MPSEKKIRDGLLTSARWNGVSWFAQSLYVRLLLLADDSGKYESRGEVIKNTAFPLSGDVSVFDVLSGLAELEDINLIEIKGDKIQLTKWEEKKESRKAHTFVAPTREEAVQYARSISLPDSEVEWFFDHHIKLGWKYKNMPIVDWKAAMRTWKKNWIKFNPLMGPKKPVTFEEQLGLARK
jgi:hypothetical protein